MGTTTTQQFALHHTGAAVLAVDDERRMLDSLVACLSPYQLEVDTALGGDAACQALLRREYDLVLLDLNMGVVNGHDVLDFAREHNMPRPRRSSPRPRRNVSAPLSTRRRNCFPHWRRCCRAACRNRRRTMTSAR